LATGKEWRTVGRPGEDSTLKAFSPDGRVLATGEHRGALRLWELISGKERYAFHGHESRIHSIAFSPDGRRLAASSTDAPVYVWDVAANVARPSDLSPRAFERAWIELRDTDAEKAYHAIGTFASDPNKGAPFLGERLRPVAPLGDQRPSRLIADLDSEHFAARNQAMAELSRLGELAEPALRKALTGQPSAEARRRLEQLLEKVEGPVTDSDSLRSLRAVEALENMGTPKAREILREIAKGSPDARLTQEAKSSLERLTRRSR
jgi:WD40 repeat protein